MKDKRILVVKYPAFGIEHFIAEELREIGYDCIGTGNVSEAIKWMSEKKFKIVIAGIGNLDADAKTWESINEMQIKSYDKPFYYLANMLDEKRVDYLIISSSLSYNRKEITFKGKIIDENIDNYFRFNNLIEINKRLETFIETLD